MCSAETVFLLFDKTKDREKCRFAIFRGGGCVLLTVVGTFHDFCAAVREIPNLKRHLRILETTLHKSQRSTMQCLVIHIACLIQIKATVLRKGLVGGGVQSYLSMIIKACVYHFYCRPRNLMYMFVYCIICESGKAP